jgi:hypothetical protein
VFPIIVAENKPKRHDKSGNAGFLTEMGIDRLHPEPRMGFPTVWDH